MPCGACSAIDSANLGSMFDSDEHSIDDVLNTLDYDDAYAVRRPDQG